MTIDREREREREREMDRPRETSTSSPPKDYTAAASAASGVKKSWANVVTKTDFEALAGSSKHASSSSGGNGSKREEAGEARRKDTIVDYLLFLARHSEAKASGEANGHPLELPRGTAEVPELRRPGLQHDVQSQVPTGEV